MGRHPLNLGLDHKPPVEGLVANPVIGDWDETTLTEVEWKTPQMWAEWQTNLQSDAWTKTH